MKEATGSKSKVPSKTLGQTFATGLIFCDLEL